MVNALIKQAVLLGLVFYCLPGIWWTYNNMDEHIKDVDNSDNGTNDDADEDDVYFLSVRFLMSTGLLLVTMSMTYVVLPIDLIPDFIPIVGGLDDKIATLICGMGFMMTYMGYQFGTGDIPSELEMIVSTTITTYNTIIKPLFVDHIIPMATPIIKAAIVPMKMVAKQLLGKIMDSINDPKVQDAARETIMHTMAEGSGGGGGGGGTPDL